MTKNSINKKKTIIIAEIGINHNCSTSIAYKLITKAKESGADYVKFQIFNTRNLVTNFAKKAEYQMISKKESQKEMLIKYQLNDKQIKEIFNYCKNKKIKFIITPFDIESLKYVKKYNLDYIKISSGDLDNIQLIQEVIKLNKKIILSSGMSSMSDINFTLNYLKKKKFDLKKVSLLHCVSSYPTQVSDINLNSILYLRKKLKLNIGLSDHTESTLIPALAVMLNANIIEKHITLNKKMIGPDHKASLNPEQFKLMIKNIRQAELSKGTFEKKISKVEVKNAKVAKRSIVSSCYIKKGEKLNINNITTKRPAVGISAKYWDIFLRRKAKKNIKEDKLICYENTTK